MTNEEIIEPDEYAYQIGEILVKHFKDEKGFIKAYEKDNYKILRLVARKMNPVPYDLKERLEDTFNHLTTNEADESESA